MTTPIRILGIDPGSRVTGFGVIDLLGRQQTYVASGCIKTPPKAALSERIAVLFEHISEVIATYQPTVSALEQVFVTVTPAAPLLLGQERNACVKH